MKREDCSITAMSNKNRLLLHKKTSHGPKSIHQRDGDLPRWRIWRIHVVVVCCSDGGITVGNMRKGFLVPAERKVEKSQSVFMFYFTFIYPSKQFKN